MDAFIYDQTPLVEHNSDIQKIIVNEGITSIGVNAFYQTNATSIKLPNTLTYIAPSAFHNTKISEIVIPNSVTEMGYHALSGLNLTSLTIGIKQPSLFYG